MNPSQEQTAQRVAAQVIEIVESPKFLGPKGLRILFLCKDTLENTVHDALSRLLRHETLVFADCRELWMLPLGRPFHLAILQEALSNLDLELASRIIRRRWPQTKILLLRADVEFLDDALYDDRMAPPIEAEMLWKTSQRLLGMRGE